MIIHIIAIAFLIMGVVGLFSPIHITRFFSFTPLSIDMKNEVRGVYGGFGIAMAILLEVSPNTPQWQTGIILTISVALLGMATGRIISFIIDKQLNKFPLIFFTIELIAGILLLSQIAFI